MWFWKGLNRGDDGAHGDREREPRRGESSAILFNGGHRPGPREPIGAVVPALLAGTQYCHADIATSFQRRIAGQE